jgi:50S ribosomal protein L16 3-hydroxylase
MIAPARSRVDSGARAPERIDQPTPLLGGLAPSRFMQRHWHRRPLLIRQAVPGVVPPVSRSELFALAARDDVESRLVIRDGRNWTLRHGPLRRRALPPLRRPAWTLLVQGLDLHVPAAHELLRRFRFLPDARLDDLMLSYASDGGGVGPHVDSYDVFLLQVHGVREWRIGRVDVPRLKRGVPLKLLTNFIAEQTWQLEPGDMLYLPPNWAHDGIARGGDCMTASIGFRAPESNELANEVLQRLLDAPPEAGTGQRYHDAGQPATATPACVPASLQAFAAHAVAQACTDPQRLARALGEWLSEPKPSVTFAHGAAGGRGGGVQVDARTRLLYDEQHVYINGESYRASGVDARLLRALADRRVLGAADLARLTPTARALLHEWVFAGWLHRVQD